MLYDPAARLVFLHNPKAAGTSVKAALEGALGVDRVKVLKACGLAEHSTLADVRARVDLKGVLVLAVIRDPLERLASLWRFGRARTADGKGSRVAKGLRHLNLPPEELEAIAATVEGADLEDWLRFCLARAWCPWKELECGRSVVERRQVEWMPGRAGLAWRADRLDDFADCLRKTRGLEVTFETLNGSGEEAPEITPWVRDWAREAYAADYDLLARL